MQKNISKIIILLILISILAGCNDTIDKLTNNEPIINSTDKINNSNDAVKIGEMNIGNRKCLMIKDNNTYYIDSNDKNKLYMIDNQFKNKILVCDKYVLEIVSVTDNEIYFIQVTKQNEKPSMYDVCSINKNGDSYQVVISDVISAIFLNDKIYYYRTTDEVADMAGNMFCNFNSFDINLKEEKIIDEKILHDRQPVLYKNKIFYIGTDHNFIEYNPDTEEKKKLNVNIEFFYRYSDDNIYAYKVNTVESTILSDNTKMVIMPEMEEIYYIWEMNVTKDYIFFLAQDTKEKNEIYRLNLYRMRKDGSELKKIYFTDYTRDIIFTEHFIYNFGDKLLLYERNENNYLSSRNKFQLIDYEGNEIDSSVFNYK